MKRANKDWQELRVREWILSHRGVLSQVAVTCGVTPQFVQMTAYGKGPASPNAIERELKKRGWPGIHIKRTA